MTNRERVVALIERGRLHDVLMDMVDRGTWVEWSVHDRCEAVWAELHNENCNGPCASCPLSNVCTTLEWLDEEVS